MTMMNDHMPIATGAHYKIEHSPPRWDLIFSYPYNSTVKLLLLRSVISE